MIRLKISNYRLYRRRFLRPRRHFLAFFKLYQKIQLKTRQHFKNRINPSHQNLILFFLKIWKMLIYFDILTNFDYISYFDISPIFYICILKFWEICTQRTWGLMKAATGLTKSQEDATAGELAARAFRPGPITLSEARSRLDRSRFSRPNTHFLAFFKIYKKITFSRANSGNFC